MSNLKLQLRECLLNNRPNLSEKSLQSYISTLFNIPKKMNVITESCDFYKDNVNEILDYIKDKKPNTRKSILSPLVVLTGIDKYKTLMNEDLVSYNDLQKKQEKTEKQIKNWLD